MSNLAVQSTSECPFCGCDVDDETVRLLREMVAQ